MWTIIWFAAQNQSYEYAVACVPNSTRAESDANDCNIRIFSSHGADVTISTHDSTTNVQLQPGIEHVMNFGASMWPRRGVEKKGIIITSNEEIVVVSESLDPTYEYFQDAYQVRQQSNASQEYFAIAVRDRHCLSNTRYNYYLSVVAHEDDTDELVTYNDYDGSEEDYNLDKFDVLTLITNDHMDEFVSGTRISASKEVLVVSGDPCLAHDEVGTYPAYGSAVTDVLPLDNYGMDFIAPSIGYPGYMLNFIASEYNTIITHNGGTTTIDAGDVYRYEYPYHDNICYSPLF